MSSSRSNTFKYIIKRLLLAVLVLLVVSLVLYFLVRLMPVSYFEDKYREPLNQGQIKPEEYARIMELLGFKVDSTGAVINDFPTLIAGYFNWLWNFIRGDMGVSFTMDMPVGEAISSTMGISFIISLVSLILQMIIAIPLGIKCAVNQYGKFDYTVTVICMVCMAFPSFFFGNILIKWLSVDLGWFPVGGLTGSLPVDASAWDRFIDVMHHLALPMIVLVVLSVGGLMRYTRTNTLEVLNADYIRTARAKGLSERTVIYKHVFRNTLIPLVTQLAFTLPGLFGGAMITETVFDIPGIGQVAYNALKQGDIPFVMGYNMFIAILTVLGILLADLAYALVDPRVKLGG